MNKIHQISKLLIFFVIGFGILDLIPDGLKQTPRILLLLFIGLVLSSYLISKESNKYIDYSLIFIVLVSSIGLTNFLIDAFDKPITLALDCDGHHAMEFHWFKGFVFGPILTIIIAAGYSTKKHKKTTLDILFSGLCIITLILSTLKTDSIMKINDQINKTSVATLVLPEDC